MTSARLVLALVGASAVLAAGCGSSEPAAEPAPAVTVTETAPAPTESASKGGGEPAESPPAVVGGEKIKVPNVVGQNHQAAQNAMQEAGLFMLAEEDATGQGRMLLMDRNWVVVKQDPKAGTVVDANATITLYSKKQGE